MFVADANMSAAGKQPKPTKAIYNGKLARFCGAQKAWFTRSAPSGSTAFGRPWLSGDASPGGTSGDGIERRDKNKTV